MRLCQAPRLLVSSLLLTGVLPVAAEQSVEKPAARVAEPERLDIQGRNTCLLNELGIAILYPNVRGSIPSAPP